MKLYGPRHTSTIYGLTFSTSVSTIIMFELDMKSYFFNAFLQIAVSIVLTVYTQTVFEAAGYEWTFIIMGFLATGGILAEGRTVQCFNVNMFICLIFRISANILLSRRCRFGNLQREIWRKKTRRNGNGRTESRYLCQELNE